MYTEGYRELACAVIEQAAKDYREIHTKIREKKYDAKTLEKKKIELDEIEKFMDGFSSLTKYIIKELRKEQKYVE